MPAPGRSPSRWLARCGCASTCRRWDHSCSFSCLLPARLDHPGDLAAHRDLADLVAREAELAERATRAARDGATVAKPHGRSVARQRLQLGARFFLRLVRGLGVLDDGEKLFPLLRELLDGRAALRVAVDDGKLGH